MTYLLYDDSLGSPELRHELGERIHDPVGFIEHDGRRIVMGSSLDQPLLEKRDDVVDEYWSFDELGYEDLVEEDSFPVHLIGPELVMRALGRLQARSVIVPSTFRTLVADHLRSEGIEVRVDEEAWSKRRRRKSPWELEGIERAQRAAETGMLTATRMLREAEPTRDGLLRFEGEILTSELIRETMTTAIVAQGALPEGLIIASGEHQGHDAGSGPILPDVPCIVDCWPRDRGTGVYTDMSRTFVPGAPSDEVLGLHKHCKAALELALESLRPGRSDVYATVCDYFESHGFPTQRTHSGSAPMRAGFVHALGHGVGLEVHERPRIGRRSDELLEGDVVAVEPGLYLEGIGGVRLEDTVVITEDGPARFTDPFPYDLSP